jgi:hypothetical protein
MSFWLCTATRMLSTRIICLARMSEAAHRQQGSRRGETAREGRADERSVTKARAMRCGVDCCVECAPYVRVWCLSRVSAWAISMAWAVAAGSQLPGLRLGLRAEGGALAAPGVLGALGVQFAA